MTCRLHISGDSTRCNHCGQRWDTGDIAPPTCPEERNRRVLAAGRLTGRVILAILILAAVMWVW